MSGVYRKKGDVEDEYVAPWIVRFKQSMRNFIDGLTLAETFWGLIAATVLCTALAGATACLYNVAKSDKRIDYCYVQIDSTTGVTKVMGHRSWTNDTNVAIVKDFREAKEVMDAVCPK